MKRFVTLTLLMGLAILLGGGIYKVFRLRFESGDVYPEYSTLRADPLGAKACYQILEDFPLGQNPDYLVDRNMRDVRLLKASEDSTFVFAGVAEDWLSDITTSEFDALDAAIRGGTRVVFTFSPLDTHLGESIESVEAGLDEDDGEKAPSTPDDVLDAEAKKGKPGEEPGSDDDDDGIHHVDMNGVEYVSLPKKWKFRIGSAGTEDWEEGIDAKVLLDDPLLGASVKFRSPWRFAQLGPEWKAIAEIGGRPVIVEKQHGRGAIVLVSDSYFLSNEGIARSPHSPEARLLLWIAGERRRLVFDETHHFIEESEGVIAMAARYNLDGVIPGLVLLFLLVLWRGGSSLVPGDEALDIGMRDAVTVSGIDADSGVVRMMRGGIPPRDILRQCYLAWARNPILRKRYSTAQVEAVRDAVVAEEAKPRRERSFPGAYHRIVQSLSRRDAL
jgi:hypothetical protein